MQGIFKVLILLNIILLAVEEAEEEMGEELAVAVATDKAQLLFQFKDIQYQLEVQDLEVEVEALVVKVETQQFLELRLLAEDPAEEALEGAEDQVELAVDQVSVPAVEDLVLMVVMEELEKVVTLEAAEEEHLEHPELTELVVETLLEDLV
jgi:hypothetical protein